MGIYKKPRPFNHIFGGDRISRAWYRGIKNAGPRKRAQGRAQDIPYHHISPYHHGIWRIFIECGKKPHARKSAQGRSARGPILPKSNRNFWQPPYVYTVCVVDNKCSGVLSSWYQSCKWHGVTTSALVKQPFLPGLKTQAAWASWSWPSGATDFYSKSANPSKLAFSVSQSFPNFCPVVPLDQDLNAAIAML